MAGISEISGVAPWRRVVTALVTFGFALASRAEAQGSVQGQVSLQERPGETTTDLGNVVVSLDPVQGTPRTRVVPAKGQIAMERRRFSPQVIVVTPGSRVDFPNNDPFDHNIFSNDDNAGFDLGLYGRGESKPATFAKAGAYAVYCNIHSRMVGHVVVVSTPLVTQAGADGRWEIAKVPAGKYQLHIWHNRAPELVREVTVPAAGIAIQETMLDTRGWKFVAHKNKFGQEYKPTGERY
jgi:plastocyanin